MNDAQEFLRDVRALIELSWTQGAEARTALGVPVDPWQRGAASWSLVGALVAVYDRRARLEGEAVAARMLRAACARLAELVDSDALAGWNDQLGRTQEEVLTILEKAPL